MRPFASLLPTLRCQMMRFISRLVFLVLLIGAGIAGWMAWFAFTPAPLSAPQVEFDIRPGLGLRAATSEIVQAGVTVPAWQLAWLGRLTGKAGGVKAGSYVVSAGVTPWDVLNKITRGDVTQAEVTFVEGRTFQQMREVLDANRNLRHDTAGLDDQAILARIGAKEAHPEGLFFPDTYLFAKQSSDLDVLRRAYDAMQRRLAKEWEGRAPSLPYDTPYQALIMASIVEKETGLPADRPMVASVFTNRLRRNMLLQTDPSVIYGLGQNFDGNLRKRDLLAESPYNTYLHVGLPPTPISMPGLASIQVVLNPPVSDKLYFVARGDGSSVFSRTLEEHNRAVIRYQKKNGGGG